MSEANALERRLAFLAQDPQNFHLLGECADMALGLGRKDEARELIQRALALAPGDRYFRARLATVELADGNFDAAITTYQALIDEGEVSAVVRYNLAYALLHAARFSEAKQQLALILESAEVPEAPLLMMRALHYLGEVKDAVALGEQFIAHKPQGQTLAR